MRVYRSIFQLLLSGSPFYTLSLSGAAPRRLLLVLPATASSCCTSSDSLSRMIIGLVRGSPTARKWKFCTAFSSGEQPDSGSCTPNSIVYTPKSILVPENTPHSLTQLSSFGSTLLSVYLLDCCTCSCHSTTTNGDFLHLISALRGDDDTWTTVSSRFFPSLCTPSGDRSPVCSLSLRLVFMLKHTMLPDTVKRSGPLSHAHQHLHIFLSCSQRRRRRRRDTL